MFMTEARRGVGVAVIVALDVGSAALSSASDTSADTIQGNARPIQPLEGAIV